MEQTVTRGVFFVAVAEIRSVAEQVPKGIRKRIGPVKTPAWTGVSGQAVAVESWLHEDGALADGQHPAIIA